MGQDISEIVIGKTAKHIIIRIIMRKWKILKHYLPNIIILYDSWFLFQFSWD